MIGPRHRPSLGACLLATGGIALVILISGPQETAGNPAASDAKPRMFFANEPSALPARSHDLPRVRRLMSMGIENGTLTTGPRGGSVAAGAGTGGSPDDSVENAWCEFEAYCCSRN